MKRLSPETEKTDENPSASSTQKKEKKHRFNKYALSGAVAVIALCSIADCNNFGIKPLSSDHEQKIMSTETNLTETSDEQKSETVKPDFAGDYPVRAVTLSEEQIVKYVPELNEKTLAKDLGAKEMDLVLQGIEELQTKHRLSKESKLYPLVGQLEDLDETTLKTIRDKLQKIRPEMESDPVSSLYNPNTGEQLLSTDSKEIAELQKAGWRNEGIIFGASVKNGVPVYRFYQKSTGLHRYSSDKKEMEKLKKEGWKQDDTILYASALDGQEVWQLQNPKTKRIQLTPDQEEKDALIKLGWKNQGVAFKVVPYEDLVVSQEKNRNYLKAYDSNANQIVGTLKLRTQSLLFDPSAKGKMSTGFVDAASLAQTGELLPENCCRLYLEDGSMAKGEQTIEEDIYYFDPFDGHMVIGKMVRYGTDRSAYYYDEQGKRYYGTIELNGRLLDFDEETGKLKQDAQKLFDRLSSYILSHQKKGETYSLALRIPDSNEEYLWNNGVQQSASVMKLFVMGAIYEDYETYTKQYGKSVIDQHLHAMITVSNNESWKYLTEILGNGNYAKGVEVLTKWCKQHGYTQTRMENRGYGNFTSVKDSGKILQDIYQRKLTHSAEMEKLIKQQAVPGRLLAGIPKGVTTGNKAGWLDDTQNDSLMVWMDDGVYILTLMSTDIVDYPNSTAIMKYVSEQTYQWMKENMNGTTAKSPKSCEEKSDQPDKDKETSQDKDKTKDQDKDKDKDEKKNSGESSEKTEIEDAPDEEMESAVPAKNKK